MRLGSLDYEFMMMVLALSPAMTTRQASAILSAWRKRAL